MRIIKRYPNRKMYDTQAKQYIKLTEIAEKIRSGEDIQVVDHTTGEDLTTQTLTQIIFIREKEQAGFLPHTVLAGLIQSGGQRLSAVQRSLVSSIGLNRLVDEEIERRVRSLVEAGELSAREAEKMLLKLVQMDELEARLAQMNLEEEPPADDNQD